MPRVWITVNNSGLLVASEKEDLDGMPVDMNASLLRQIKAANKQFVKFQNLLVDFYEDAVNHPDTVRRVR